MTKKPYLFIESSNREAPIDQVTARSLLRFNCVSKSWKTLISEPYFARKHLNHAKNDQNSQRMFICELGPEDGIFSMYCCPLSSNQLVEDVRKLNFPSVCEPLYCSSYCGCDGLAIVDVSDNIADECSILLLWNPSTRQSVVLPYPKPGGIFCLGMGYDSRSDYKILKIMEVEDFGCEIPCEILALKSGSWKKIDKHPHGIRSMLSAMHSLAFVHVAFHWIGISRNYYVVSFNISNEVYGEMPLPEQICLMSNIGIGISVLEGMLCVYSTSNFVGGDTF
uniref:F-box protein At3g16210 n=1 Tax=Nicotiana tabacum TaxID=4097 RepID=A0A1S4DR74_TOBAC|nr:PREDICTED: putative F-box protein At3g16210 [Nicotiana tabacum]